MTNDTLVTRRQFLGSTAAVGAAALLGRGLRLPDQSSKVFTPTGSAPFRGVTINVGVGSFMASGVTMFVNAWEKWRGGSVTVTQIPLSDLYSKLESAFSSHASPWDVVIYASDWISEFALNGWIIDLEPYYPQKTNWDSVIPQVQRIMRINGKRYSVPMDGDVITMYYRKDAFGHPKAATNFKAKYGYDLPVPPQTWKQYLNCAEFFTGWDWAGNGKPCYGVLEAMGPKDVGPYILTTHAAPYAANPKYPGSLFFDPDTMDPQIDNPGWVQALDDWIALKKFGPPQMVTWGGGDMRGNVVVGNYALAIDWGDTGIAAQSPTESKVKYKMGYGMVPAADRVWDYKKASWTYPAEPNRAPYQGWGGWHASVTATSQHPEAAWDFADFLDTTSNALRAVTTPGTARNPYRIDEFKPINWTNSAVHFYDPEGYLDSIWKSLTNPNAQLDLRIPQAGQYFNALDSWSQQALSGSMSSQAALKQCAAAWRTLTQTYGVSSLKALYDTLEK